jgi:peptidoglycan/xylan/chitin deacetylase (PgdA/CDA1 family)
VSSGAAVVLLYHRIASLDRDVHGLAVHPNRFAEQCEVLGRRYEVVPLREIDHSRRQVVITFDDGYADNGIEARRILAGARLPATFFVASGRIGSRGEAWWDRLERMVFDARHAVAAIDTEVAGQRLWADMRSAEARNRAHMALYWRLQPLRPVTIHAFLDELQVALYAETSEREEYRWMAAEELRLLSECDGVEIGAHTRTHPLLAKCTRDEQWEEIRGSREQLEALVGKPVVTFSYPYGGSNAFDAVTIGLVREAGFTCACTTLGGAVRAGCEPFQVPRNRVGDWDGATFDRWLTSVLSG